MELVHQYMSTSLFFQCCYVIQLWNEQGIKATPEIASFIEKECGITRDVFKQQIYQSGYLFPKDNNEEACKLILAYIIYCIDYQCFQELGKTFSLLKKIFY